MASSFPTLIQGGMGAGVSGWRLARAVARRGQLGVVSGTALDSILVRHLQTGDKGGHYRAALERFPFPEIARRVLAKHFVPGGKAPDAPFTRLPLHTASLTREQQELIVLAAFAEVDLARQGHGGPVGINLLEKIQLPNLPSLYGAMLAGVDYVLIGAGIPWQIPGALDRLARHEPAEETAMVEGALPGESFTLRFDPAIFGDSLPHVERPRFLAIVSSPVLAAALVKRATGRIDGFVVESPLAGGHNAPPRGALKLTPEGEPVYGPRDEVDWEAMRRLGLPFYIAGTCGSPARLREARALGAQGVQVGTLFALCEESGLAPHLKRQILELCRSGNAHVFTDPTASPTGFPFKVVELEGTLSERALYEVRRRRCDLGYLRRPYRRDDGTVGYRCPSEPVDDYARKGGNPAETDGRKCLCNALVANIGLEQVDADGYRELPLVTAGSDLHQLDPFLDTEDGTFTAEEVVAYMLAETAAP